MGVNSDLSNLFAELFNESELRQFPGKTHWSEDTARAVRFSLPGGASRGDLAYELTETLRRHGLIDAELFKRLVEQRPGFEWKIRRVEQVCRTALPHAWTSGSASFVGPRLLMFMGVPQNRRGEKRLRIDEEHAKITERLGHHLYRERLKMVDRWAVSEDELFLQLARADDAHAFHFSGHCLANGRLVIHSADGANKEVGVDAMVDALGEMAPEFLFLNACYSKVLGEALIAANVGRCIIAMNDPVPDSVSIRLADQFYAAAADGMSIGKSFRVAIRAIDAFSRKGSNIPELLHPSNVNPDTEFLLRESHAT